MPNSIKKAGSCNSLIKSTRGHSKPSVVYGVGIGGSAFSLMRGQLKWFSEQGWDVTLACTPDEKSRLTIEREGVNFRSIPTKREIRIWSDLLTFGRWLRFLVQARPDAVNVGTPKAGLLGGVAAWLTRVPKRIYVVRGLRLEGASGLLARVLWLMEWISAAVATDVVVVSHSLGQELVDRGLVSSKKCWLIGDGSSNGVDAASIAARVESLDRADLREIYGIAQDAVGVGYIGRVAKDKGVDTLIEAFRSTELSTKIHLIIIGGIEDVKLAETLQTLGDRVHVLNWTQDVWGKLPLLDVLCLPTRREGFPNVVLEAAAAGIPTVTTRATGAVDSVLAGKTGFLIDIDDPKGVVNALNEFADNSELIQQMGEAARERATLHFPPERIWSGLQALLVSDFQASGLTRLDRVWDREDSL